MKVALVHDDLVQWGGAERVLEGLCEIFPGAPIYTSLYDDSNPQLSKRFGGKKIVTSFLQHLPGWKDLYRPLLPVYPLAFEQFRLDDYDLVISHATRFAKCIITKPATLHVCYCPTPPRFLWGFDSSQGLSITELPVKVILNFLREQDKLSSQRVDHFVANSKNTQDRIRSVYKLSSSVVYPFVDLSLFNVEPFDGGYFLIVSRLKPYKKVDLAIEACTRLGLPLKIVGVGEEMDHLKNLALNLGRHNLVSFLGSVDDICLANLLAGSKALIIPGLEDFGMVSLEAQASGSPVIAYKGGGALETVIDGRTGLLFENQTAASLIDALKALETVKIDPWECRNNAAKFNKKNFQKKFLQTIDSLVYT